jgi:signal transduction histidine kinase
VNRLGIRTRLTLLYVALVVVAGGILVGTTYLLVGQSFSRRFGPPTPRLDGPSPDQPPTPEQIAQFRREAEQFRQNVKDSALTTVLTRGIIALVVVTVLVLLLSWILAGRALEPLHRITATAHRIAGNPTPPQGLRERISLTGPQDEVKELADTFDDMVGQLDRAFDAQRRFVANASHELRTPLAANRSVIEVAITRPGASPDVIELGRKLLAVNDRHTQLVDALLTLAEAENADLPTRLPVDLAETVERAVRNLPAHDLTVRTDLRPVTAVGDPVMLERITQNLLDNAVKHNVPGGWIEIRTSALASAAHLSVRNSGAVISAEEAQAVFEPFRRLRSARTGTGVGLGLSIVGAITAAHGGSVRATPVEAGGLDLEIILPAG